MKFMMMLSRFKKHSSFYESCVFFFPRMVYAGDPKQLEFATLQKVQDYCEATPNGRALYFHSKGASKDMVRWMIHPQVPMMACFLLCITRLGYVITDHSYHDLGMFFLREHSGL